MSCILLRLYVVTQLVRTSQCIVFIFSPILSNFNRANKYLYILTMTKIKIMILKVSILMAEIDQNWLGKSRTIVIVYYWKPTLHHFRPQKGRYINHVKWSFWNRNSVPAVQRLADHSRRGNHIKDALRIAHFWRSAAQKRETLVFLLNIFVKC